MTLEKILNTWQKTSDYSWLNDNYELLILGEEVSLINIKEEVNRKLFKGKLIELDDFLKNLN